MRITPFEIVMLLTARLVAGPFWGITDEEKLEA